jgi:hypothetical protein
MNAANLKDCAVVARMSFKEVEPEQKKFNVERTQEAVEARNYRSRMPIL